MLDEWLAALQVDWVVARTSPDEHSYRHRPNGLETLKTTPNPQENRWGSSIRPCAYGRTWEAAGARLWKERAHGRVCEGVITARDRGAHPGVPGFTAKGNDAGTQPHFGEGLLSAHGRLRTLFQRLEGPDHAFAGVVRELEILGKFERIGRASIFAQTAEHATAQVVGEFYELFAAGFFIALAGNNDQVFRAGHRAQVGGNRESLVGIGVDVQPRRASVALGYLRPLQRILLGVDFLGMLISERHAKSLHQVHQKHLPQEVGDSHNTHRITLTGNSVPARAGCNHRESALEWCVETGMPRLRRWSVCRPGSLTETWEPGTEN